MTNHPLIRTLKNLRGNVRGCVYTEPLWGIPFNLYAPYVSIYMLAFGLTDSQIGLITTIGLSFEIVWTLLSGAITDKLGRKRTTLLFDIISWSVPSIRKRTLNLSSPGSMWISEERALTASSTIRLSA